jgi:Holliday junction resolvase
MNGLARERQLRERLRSQGWWVIRAAGSLGDADLVALKDGQRPRLIELKANAEGGPFKNFGPTDRAELLEAAQCAGADALLCWWPARKDPRWIGSSDWPG